MNDKNHLKNVDDADMGFLSYIILVAWFICGVGFLGYVARVQILDEAKWRREQVEVCRLSRCPKGFSPEFGWSDFKKRSTCQCIVSPIEPIFCGEE